MLSVIDVWVGLLQILERVLWREKGVVVRIVCYWILVTDWVR